MTEIVVACRDGILRAPDGTQYRMVRGKTLADGKHPAVLANPDSFMPVEVELSLEDVDPGHLEDAVAVDLAELREDAKRAEVTSEVYRVQLVRIADELMSRGLIPSTQATDYVGWLVDAVRNCLDLMTSADGHAMDGKMAEAVTDDVPPPRPRKPRVPRG